MSSQKLQQKGFQLNQYLLFGMSQSASTTLSQSAYFIDYKKWNQLLFCPQLAIKIEQFRKWHKNPQTLHHSILAFPNKDLLQKDIVRTRSTEKYMKNQKFLNLLKAIVVFYCTQNSINYQQGLLEIAVPFALLKSSQCKARQCYAYFDSFMNGYFPSLLTQKLVHHKKQLPMASLALHFVSVLLNYLLPQVFYHLKHYQIPLSMIFTQELLTVFAKGMQMELVYEVFERFMIKCGEMQQYSNCQKMFNSNNSLMVLIIMSVSLIGLKEQEILEKQEQQIHAYLSKSLKSFKTIEELDYWFEIYENIKQKVPVQFYAYFQRSLNLISPDNQHQKKLLNKKPIKTQQEYEIMIQKDRQEFSFFIEVQYEDLQKRQVVFHTTSCTKIIQKTFKNIPIFSFQKWFDGNLQINEIKKKFDSFIHERKWIDLEERWYLEESNNARTNYLYKFIECIQTKNSMKCVKMFIDQDKLNSKHNKYSSQRKMRCALI